ncbi:MAG: hypothetical protein ACK56X_10830 [Planctomyces sp.]
MAVNRRFLKNPELLQNPGNLQPDRPLWFPYTSDKNARSSRRVRSGTTPMSLSLSCLLLSLLPCEGTACSQSATTTVTAPNCHFDVVVYHAGPAGMAAAVAAASEGCSVLLADPAPLAALPAADLPDITIRQQTEIVLVHRPPGTDRITAITLQSTTQPKTAANDRQTLTCGIVIDASDTGDLLELCGEARRCDPIPGRPFRQSLAVALLQPNAADRLTDAISEPIPGEARTLLHADSIACRIPAIEPEHTVSAPGQGRGIAFRPTRPAISIQIPSDLIVPRHLKNLLVPCGFSSLGKAAGFAAAQALREQTSVQQLYVPALQQQMIAAGCSLTHVSDVTPNHPDFAAVQWWGLQGGFHGLHRTPVPFQLPDMHSNQSVADSPDHAARLDHTLSPALAKRWQTIAVIAGVPPQQLLATTPATTRGDFIRHAWSTAMRIPPAQFARSTSPHAAPRINPAALPGTHPPGEVDNQQLAALVIRNADMLPGIVVDDCDAELQGDWQYSTHTPPYVGRGYLHDMNAGKGRKSATYRPHLPTDGWYEVRLSHCRNIRRSTSTLITISHADGHTSLRLNQQLAPEHAQLFRTLGRFRFTAGSQHWVRIANDDTTGKYVIADAVQWIPVDAPVSRTGPGD